MNNTYKPLQPKKRQNDNKIVYLYIIHLINWAFILCILKCTNINGDNYNAYEDRIRYENFLG